MRRRSEAWLGCLLALFMVLVQPACWFGAQLRTALAELPTGSGSSSNEEEREHAEDGEQRHVDPLGVRPRPGHAARARATVARRPAPPHAPVLRTQVPAPHPSRYSSRRLI